MASDRRPPDVLDRVRELPWHPRTPKASIERLISHLEDYLFIGGDSLSASQAAKRIGVTPRSVTRWRATLKIASGIEIAR